MCGGHRPRGPNALKVVLFRKQERLQLALKTVETNRRMTLIVRERVFRQRVWPATKMVQRPYVRYDTRA